MTQLSKNAEIGIVVAVVIVVAVGIAVGLYYLVRHFSKSSKKTTPKPQPSNAVPGPAPPSLLQRAGTALASTDFVVDAKKAKDMLADKANKSTLIVAMQGCGACQRLRAALKEMKDSGKLDQDADRVGVLLTNEWAQLKDKLPANAMPQMFKVGGGEDPVKGPTGYRDPASLLEYIKSK